MNLHLDLIAMLLRTSRMDGWMDGWLQMHNLKATGEPTNVFI